MEARLLSAEAERRGHERELELGAETRADIMRQLTDAAAQRGELEALLDRAVAAQQRAADEAASASAERKAALGDAQRSAARARALQSRVSELETAAHDSAAGRAAADAMLAGVREEVEQMRRATGSIQQEAVESAVVHESALEQQRDRARAELARLEDARRHADSERDAFRQELDSVAAKHAALEGELAASRAAELRALHAAAAQEHDARDAQAEAARLAEELSHLRRERGHLEQRIAVEAAAVGTVEGQLGSVRDELRDATACAAQRGEQLGLLRREAAADTVRLETQVRTLTTGLCDLEHQLKVTAVRTGALEEAMDTAVVEAEEAASRAGCDAAPSPASSTKRRDASPLGGGSPPRA